MGQESNSYKNIIVDSWREKEGVVGRITFNRPERLNVISQDMGAETFDALDRFEDDDDVKVVIFRGAGQTWPVGFDLNQVGPRTKDGKLVVPKAGDKGPGQANIRSRLRSDHRTASRFQHLLMYTKPTIAQVHGHCYGGGFHYQAACDITIAAEDTKVGFLEQRLGFAGAHRDLIMLINLVGYKRAREYLLTGRVMSGKEAAEVGLINRAVPLAKLEETVRKLARTITLMPRDGIIVGKAQTELAYHRLGFAEGFVQGYVGHHVYQSVKYEDDEFIFVKARRDLGTRGAIHARDSRYDEQDERPVEG